MYKYCCTNCNYIYNPFVGDEEQSIIPGTFFEDLPEDYYCPLCSESKDGFYGIKENIQEVLNKEDLTEQEEEHTTFFYKKDGKIFITIGNEDNSHPSDDGHFIEYIGIFDDVGDLIEMKKFPDPEEEIIFDIGEIDDCEVRSSCNLHGVWKGIEKK
ncbi:rubredoxin [Candidatus Gracilibacteria bacterium]|nr:rubredoxin [Candidatus Gracilibacteria bacterium]